MTTEEEIVFDDELNDELLPTEGSGEGEGTLYEHFRVVVDKGKSLSVLISSSSNGCNTPVVTVFRRLLMQGISM